jgi:ABC-2 type transport system permease protein
MVNLESRKLEDVLKFLIVIVSIVLVNELASRHFWRFDLTSEKRYSISDATKNMLRGLDDVVFVEVYLTGHLPSDFERFRKSIGEMLEQFRAYGGRKIQYAFIDPVQAKGEQARNEAINRLGQMGIQPTNVMATEKGQRIEKLVFPGAAIFYKNQSVGITLLKGDQGASSQQILNQSVEGVEYELASAIQDLTEFERKTIGLVKGHGELDSLEVAGLNAALNERYRTRPAYLYNDLSPFDALIIAKPTQPFSERDKYHLDQYIMNGGKVMFMIDAVEVDSDSIGGEGTVAVPIDLNLTDLLFQYGVRLNTNLVLDMNSALFPAVVGQMGNQPQIRPMPWPYFPLINQFANHPIVRNLDAVSMKYASTIDTVRADGIKKTPLLFTSQHTRLTQAPIPVSLNLMRAEMRPELFTSSHQPVGYLLEGSFNSLYQNRFLPAFANKETFKSASGPAKIIVVADGNVARNEVNRQNGRPYPLGFDPVLQTTLGNKDFIMNSLSYLLNDEGLILARNKEIQIRPLDKFRAQDQKVFWQVLNLIVPIALVILFGVVKFYVRKRKYSRF